MRARHRLLQLALTATAAATTVAGCAGGPPHGRGAPPPRPPRPPVAREQGDARVADPAQAILGEWRGTGPCDGTITFRPDGTYERRHYSPGDYRVAGAWVLRGEPSPPTLSLTCNESDDQDHVGRVVDVTLVRLDANELLYRIGETASRYERDVTAARRP